MNFNDLVSEDLIKINLNLKNKLKEFKNNTILDEALEYALLSSGKRIRPILLKHTYDMLNKNSDIAIDTSTMEDFMIAIEFIHCYSLVHDDLPAMDNSDFRRGLPTVHKQFNEYLAVLVGDSLLNTSMEIVTRALLKNNDEKVIKAANVLFAYAGHNGMIKGQALDLTSKNETELKALEALTYYKTVKLIKAAMLLGAILSGVDEENIKKIEELSGCIGMLFQIQDDVIDFEEDSKENRLSYATFYGLTEIEKIKDNYKNNAIRLLDEIDKNNVFFKELIKFLLERKR